MLVRELATKLNTTNQKVVSVLGDTNKKQSSKLTDEEIEKVTSALSEDTEENIEVEIKTEKAVKKPITKEFKNEDPVRCSSITSGELILVGRSGIQYNWQGVGDIRDVRYDDILALKYAKSKFLTDPLFIIEDEELLNDSKFSDLKILYDSIYSADIQTLLALPNEQFEATLMAAPEGFKNAVKVEVKTLVENDEFDSLQKIQAVERICGVEILNLK